MISDLGVIANLPEKITIGGKEYSIKAPSIGVSALVARKMRELLELTGIAPDELKDLSAAELFGKLWKSIFDLFTTEKAERAVDLTSEIIALLINNKPLEGELIVTPEEIKWNMRIDELTPLLARVLHMADLMPFFLNLLRVGMAYDVEGILSDSQGSSFQSHTQQVGRSNT